MYASLYEAFLKTRQDYTFYVPPQREDYLSLETRFEKNGASASGGRAGTVSSAGRGSTGYAVGNHAGGAPEKL